MNSEVGARVSGVLSNTERNALRPAMIGVNSLVEAVTGQAKTALSLSAKSVQAMQSLFREKLSLPYTIAILPDADLRPQKR